MTQFLHCILENLKSVIFNKAPESSNHKEITNNSDNGKNFFLVILLSLALISKALVLKLTIYKNTHS